MSDCLKAHNSSLSKEKKKLRISKRALSNLSKYNTGKWTEDEKEKFLTGVLLFKNNWSKVRILNFMSSFPSIFLQETLLKSEVMRKSTLSNFVIGMELEILNFTTKRL